MFKKQLQPLSDGDKAILVLSFLEDKGETAFEGLPPDEINDMLLATPHYTLINFLEFFYVYRKNSRFANNVNGLAEQFGISLKNLPLNPQFLIRLGFTFISTRPNLTEADKKAIADEWVAAYEDTNKPFTSEEEARESWVRNIARTVQVYEAIHQADQEVEGSYAGLVFDNIADNRELVKRYLRYRSLA